MKNLILRNEVTKNLILRNEVTKNLIRSCIEKGYVLNEHLAQKTQFAE